MSRGTPAALEATGSAAARARQAAAQPRAGSAMRLPQAQGSWDTSPRMVAQRRRLAAAFGDGPVIGLGPASGAVPPSVAQRMLRIGMLKGKATGGLVEQGRSAELADETPITLWVNMQPETQPNAHSTVWFRCEIEGAVVLCKMDWVDKGFRVIYKAAPDAYYCEPPANAKSTTIGAAVAVAKAHIAGLGEKRATLQGHCHAFALSVFERVG